MKKPIIFILLASLFVCACNESAAPNNSDDNEEVVAKKSPSETKKPYAGGFTKEQRVSDAQTVISFFERGYAPRGLKDEMLDEKFAGRSREFLKAAGEEISDVEFYGLIAKYVNGFHDAHVDVTFPSSATASLPFLAKYLDGHIVVVGLDEDSSEVKNAFSLGDEIVEFDGKPVLDVINEILQYYGGAGNHESELSLATYQLAFRSQSAIPFLPENETAVIKIRPKNSGPEHEVKLKWKREGHEFAEFNDPGIALGLKTQKTSDAAAAGISDKENLLEKSRMWLWPMHRYLSYGIMGDSTPFFPLGSTFIGRKTEPYHTGVFVEGEKKIGYIRINTWSLRSVNKDMVLAELEEEIPYLEENTDALIIDQTRNPGGSLCLIMNISSFFFKEPFKETRSQYRANRSTLKEMEEIEADEDTSDNDRKIAGQIASGIRDALQAGKLLTEPHTECSLNGIIEPYKNKDGDQITYTKPVLIMIDELAVSGGDYFPALMQDTRRAITFGARTMGGGGARESSESPIGYSEVSISRTITLGMREEPVEYEPGKESIYIEGVGVIPDIEYRLTPDDFNDSYSSYREAAIKSALSLIPPDQEAK